MTSTIPPPSSGPGPGPSMGGATSSPAGSNSSGSGGSNNSSSAPSTLQVRTLHPQVHYIFENDPLESDILESVPKSRSITLDFDPRTGTIGNVESFLTHLQVMDVKLVPFQATLPSLSTSSSSTSLNSMMRHHAGTGGEGEDKAQAGMAGGGGGGGGVGKDWTLVINAVEVDGKDLDSESEMLEQSMLSSFDTDMGSEDPLVYSDALLKSFQTRNMLVRKVIDYTTSSSSAGAATTPQ
ncbi:hypothetical protein BGZ70_001736 [Mortierella alpina]|uniref:Uncharacterized protein n=1 Tax=Mortierella alpina TaxID=64518 RepID=A0A9P6M786_MORAP|nr:hypothetical protein BGZ70_001736 [Mortierella alpina]